MRKLRIIRSVIAIFLLIIVIFTPVINNYYASRIEKELRKTPLPEKTKMQESLSRAGKLTGNGNGMQYFGAMLIESDLSIEELDVYYSAYRRNEWEYIVAAQNRQEIEGIDHLVLKFSKKVEKSGYYIVYTWGDAPAFFKEIDIRGH